MVAGKPRSEPHARFGVNRLDQDRKIRIRYGHRNRGSITGLSTRGVDYKPCFVILSLDLSVRRPASQNHYNVAPRQRLPAFASNPDLGSGLNWCGIEDSIGWLLQAASINSKRLILQRVVLAIHLFRHVFPNSRRLYYLLARVAFRFPLPAHRVCICKWVLPPGRHPLNMTGQLMGTHRAIGMPTK